MLLQYLILLFILLTSDGYSDSGNNNISIQSGFLSETEKVMINFLELNIEQLKIT